MVNKGLFWFLVGGLSRVGLLSARARLLKTALRRWPSDPEIRFAWAVSLNELGAVADAVEQFRECLRARPKWPEALAELGDSLQAISRHEEAVVAYESLVRSGDGDARLLNNLGLSLVALGRSEEAHGAFRTAVAMAPEFGDALGNAAASAIQTGRWDQALDYSRRAVEAQPSCTHLANLGSALQQVGNHSEAEGVLTRAVRLCPEQVELRQLLAHTLSALNRHQEAVEVIGELEDSASLAALSRVLLDADRVAEAEDCARRAVRADPSAVGGWYALGWVLVASGDGNAALDAFQRGPADDPIEQMTGRASALAVLGRGAEVAEVVREIEARDPGVLSRFPGLATYLNTSE